MIHEYESWNSLYDDYGLHFHFNIASFPLFCAINKVIGDVKPMSWAAIRDIHEGCKVVKLDGKVIRQFTSKAEVMAAMKVRPLEVTILRKRPVKKIKGGVLEISQ